MTEEKGKGTQQDDLDSLLRVLLTFLEAMDTAKEGGKSMFRFPSNKTDLETKVWHCYHKVQASTYHVQRVKKLSDAARGNLEGVRNSLTNPPGVATEFQMTVTDRTILYEIDAFFAASRSALDFLGSCLSRYVRGKETDRFRDIVKFLGKSEDAVAQLAVASWNDWAEDLVDYRDYLVHAGALPTAAAAYVVITQPGPASKLSTVLQQMLTARPILYPLPTKPNRALRLTREDMLGMLHSELPDGLAETTITISADSTAGSSRVRTSISKSRGPRSATVSMEDPLSSPESMTSKTYELTPGYLEADTLCEQYHRRLRSLIVTVFDQLGRREFTYLQS